MAHHLVEEHLKRVANIYPKRVPSQATELLGTELVNTEDSAGKDDAEREPTTNQMETKQDKHYQEIPGITARLVRDVKIPLGTVKEIPV